MKYFLNFKNVANVLTDKMGDQFFRDLDKAESLTKINWFFNGRKLGNIKEFTESQKIEMIGDITSALLRNNSSLGPIYTKYLGVVSGTNPHTITKLVDKISANFDEIFKIVN